MRLLMRFALVVGFLAGAALADESAEGLRVDFDDGTLGGAIEPAYVNRSEGRSQPERARDGRIPGALPGDRRPAGGVA